MPHRMSRNEQLRQAIMANDSSLSIGEVNELIEASKRSQDLLTRYFENKILIGQLVMELSKSAK